MTAMIDCHLLLLFRGLSPPFQGGASIYVHELFQRLRGFRVTVSTSRAPDPARPETFTNGRVVRHRWLGDLAAPFRWGLPGPLRLCLTALMMLYWNVAVLFLGLRRRPRLIVLGRADFIIPAAVLLRRITGAPLVMVLYGEEWIPLKTGATRLWAMKNVLFRWGMKRTDGVVTLSRRLSGLVGEAGWAMPRAAIRPGVDTDRFRPPEDRDAARARVAPEAELLLLSLSRLVLRKGQDTVIRAMAQLRDEFPGLRLVIAGDGEAGTALRSLVDELGLADRVRFEGHVDPDDPRKVELFRAADIFALPTRPSPEGESEGFGIVYLEAGACAVPVVAGDDGGAAEAVRGAGCGLVVDGRSVDETTEAIRRLARDPELRRRLGGAGLTMAERDFGWDGLSEALERFFDRLPGAGAGKGGAER